MFISIINLFISVQPNKSKLIWFVQLGFNSFDKFILVSSAVFLKTEKKKIFILF